MKFKRTVKHEMIIFVLCLFSLLALKYRSDDFKKHMMLLTSLWHLTIHPIRRQKTGVSIYVCVYTVVNIWSGSNQNCPKARMGKKEKERM